MKDQKCLVTFDRNYLGKNNEDKFDAVVIKVRYFRTQQVSEIQSFQTLNIHTFL